MAGILVQSGDWYRLFTAMFVHVTPIHILVNMVSLWSLFLVEMVYGSVPYLILYLFSGFVGNLLSVLLLNPYDVSAGASGAIFGVFGAAVALGFQGVFPKVARNQMLLLLAINIIYDLTNPQIDLVGHLGGLASGLLFATLYRKLRRYPKSMRGVAMALSGATVLALCLTLLYSPQIS